jgi:hypothetical protein
VSKTRVQKNILAAYGKPLHYDTLLLVAGFIAMVIVVLVYNRPPFYDEPAYLADVTLLHHHGFSRDWLLGLHGSAGPLYSAVQYFFEPVTHLAPPFIRLLNGVFLLGVMYYTHLTLRVLHLYGGYAWYSMAIPVTYVVAALALTEMPAMLFFTMSLYLSVKASRTASFILVLVCALAAGICMGVAIAGRQPYLLTVPVIAFLFLLNKNPRNRWLPAFIFIPAALALPLYIFYVWNGLVPPIDTLFYARLAGQGIAWRPDSVLLCIAYFAICFLLIAPALYRLPGRKEGAGWLLLYIVLVILNCLFGWIPWLPMESLVKKLLVKPTWVQFSANAIGAGLLLFSLYFIVTIGRWAIEKKRQPETLVFFIAMLALAFTCIKITSGFSSRYAAQALPLMVLAGSYFREHAPLPIPRVLAGITIGLTSLLFYFLG